MISFSKFKPVFPAERKSFFLRQNRKINLEVSDQSDKKMCLEDFVCVYL